MVKRLLLALVLVFSVANYSEAAGINFGQEPPANVIVVRAGLQWIWAAPCAPIDPSCGAVGPPFQSGFRLASAAEWMAGWADLNDLVGAFLDGPGGELCGSPWMSPAHNHCDAVNLRPGANGGRVWGAAANICPNPAQCDVGFAEAFLVRGAAVPEPTTMFLLGTGLLAGVRARRRLNKKISG